MYIKVPPLLDIKLMAICCLCIQTIRNKPEFEVISHTIFVCYGMVVAKKTPKIHGKSQAQFSAVDAEFILSVQILHSMLDSLSHKMSDPPKRGMNFDDIVDDVIAFA